MAKKIRNAVRALNAQFIAAVANPPAHADVAAADVGTQAVQEQDDKESVQQDDDALYTLTDDEARNAFGVAQQDDTQDAPDESKDNVQSDDTQDAPREPRILEDVSKQDVSPNTSDNTEFSEGSTEKQPEVPAATVAPKLTKKLQVRNFIAATPASVATIASHMNISNIAAQSLIGDLKRDKVQVVSKKVDKVTLYTVAA